MARGFANLVVASQAVALTFSIKVSSLASSRASLAFKFADEHLLSSQYLSNFTKSGPLSDYVQVRRVDCSHPSRFLTLAFPLSQLHMSSEVPLLVQYSFAQGSIRYYLAPKIADE